MGRSRWLLLAALAFLAACGGADSPLTPQASREIPANTPQAQVAAGPGELLTVRFLVSRGVSEIAAGIVASGGRAPAVAPRYEVEAYRVTYLTRDVKGQAIEASGIVALPRKGPGAASPLVSYQHGTIFYDAQAPSNALDAGEPPFVLASQGAIVFAADYVGYGATKGVPHPYLQSAPTAAAVVDLITAVRSGLRRYGIAENGQLFLVGYSEGGYATMAAHRALQADASVHLQALVGTAPGAGPYNMQVTLDGLLDRVRDANPLIGALLNPGVLKHLGSTLRAEVRRQLVRQLLPSDADVAFDTSLIDLYLDDDTDAIARIASVHDWKPEAPVRLFHGRNDGTVPYAASTSTLQTMLARGAQNVTLTDCAATPPDHAKCVGPYFQFIVERVAPVIRDL